ncbi:glycerol-3-phosphate dehydrogenase/oxidase [Pullulanibacillus sp. KACC 23026]|uniref:glycerol-3-phosphate dehydrogenase/oxidase n=1 Tax=Pullulanibacillus sp. KACC 23026 TaxID=3028315 RepID=UPI0023B1FE0D|nr:glycerol-3-phosphate dehydrogenase/oxidase [Pullulanibacillus sp. KACC 23026]WEG13816.1 glycerol-3-phosphate dehydrogenase/oxidase [Pullulanibacillus sp. KACC 23026]
MTFSSLKRKETLSAMANKKLDLLVIGGGITGAGVALDAKVRGLDIGLVEMNDFASGTSSRSTKLVHGGLRYLKQFEVKLVAEVGKERAIVYENAPHVTKPEWMLLPMYEGGTFGPFTTSIGLKVYDFLAKVKKNERRSMLNRSQTLQREPLLKKDGLKGGGYYVEYRTDDARLTIETIKAAVAKGAHAVNYAKVDQLLYDDHGKLIGVHVTDQISQETYEIFAKKVVNAAGPWVDTIREMDKSKKGKYLHLTKGIHIVIDGKRFPMKQAVYFDTTNGDKRMIFAIPREGKVYIGTTDTFYTTFPIHPRMTAEDRDYLLEAINGMFPDAKLTPEDVESSWAGVRPLIHEEGKSPSEISRKDEIFLSHSGLITIAGGKLTGYRKMAERVVDLVGEQLEKEEGRHLPACTTDHVKLSGGEVGGSAGFPAFVEKNVQRGVALGLSQNEAKILVDRYGSNIDSLYDIIVSQEEVASTDLPLAVKAAVIYGIKEEMVVTPIDFFTRRTGATLFNINWARQWKQPVIDFMAKLFNWSTSEKEEHTANYERELEEACIPVDKD